MYVLAPRPAAGAAGAHRPCPWRTEGRKEEREAYLAVSFSASMASSLAYISFTETSAAVAKAARCSSFDASSDSTALDDSAVTSGPNERPTVPGVWQSGVAGGGRADEGVQEEAGSERRGARAGYIDW